MRTTRTISALIAIATCFLAQPVRAEQTVGQWQMVEIVLTSARSYDNPFIDVDVSASMVSPSGVATPVNGFYDGDGRGGQGALWKVRFMTPEVGTWSWRSTCSDRANDGLHDRSGSFTVVPSDVPGPLAPDPLHPNAWRHANGEHFLWSVGYSLFVAGADRTHPTVGGWQDYVDWLAERRFGGVLFLLQVPTIRSCETCWKGSAPWRALGNAKPPKHGVDERGRLDFAASPWPRYGAPDRPATDARHADFSRLYLPFWHNVDQIVGELAAHRMVAHVWQYCDETFYPPASTLDEKLFWDNILRRLGAYWNVVYNDGIDINEYREDPRWITQWQRYFARQDPFGHARSSRRGHDDGAEATWRSVAAANFTDPVSIEHWRRLLALEPRKPVTEDFATRAMKKSGTPPERFLQLAWWSALAGPGAMGTTWAGGHDPANWFANLDDRGEGMTKVEHRNRFLLDFDPEAGRAIPFWLLEPRDDLVSGENVYCSAVPGRHYLVFFDRGAPRRITIDLRAAETPLETTWLDPDSGRRIAGAPAPAGTIHTVERPFAGSAVLYLGSGEPNRDPVAPAIGIAAAAPAAGASPRAAERPQR